MASPTSPSDVLWLARLEYRLHAWRERRARRRGHRPTVAAFPGYGGDGWVRVLARVLIVPPVRTRRRGPYATVRGWRSFASVPIGFAQVQVDVEGVVHNVVADRGGVIDTVLPAQLSPGWHPISMSVEGSEPVQTNVFVVGADISFGIVSDVDDTVMVTALPRPFVAAWNSFVVDERARQPVPGMGVMLERLLHDRPGSPIIYLSTGAWNVAPTLQRFLRRHLFPKGALLLTDWGPTHDRWFRSGREHKLVNLRRLASEFPNIRWLLVGDDGQHDEGTYAQFQREHPDAVAAVAIRRLSTTEAMLAGGRAHESDDHGDSAPWVAAGDGAGLREQLTELGLLR